MVWLDRRIDADQDDVGSREASVIGRRLKPALGPDTRYELIQAGLLTTEWIAPGPKGFDAVFIHVDADDSEPDVRQHSGNGCPDISQPYYADCDFVPWDALCE